MTFSNFFITNKKTKEERHDDEAGVGGAVRKQEYRHGGQNDGGVCDNQGVDLECHAWKWYILLFVVFTQVKSDIHPDITLPRVLEIPITDTKKAASSGLIPSLGYQLYDQEEWHFKT